MSVLKDDAIKDVRMGVPNAWKMDGSELRNTLEGTECGKGGGSAERSEEIGGDAERIT